MSAGTSPEATVICASATVVPPCNQRASMTEVPVRVSRISSPPIVPIPTEAAAQKGWEPEACAVRSAPTDKIGSSNVHSSSGNTPSSRNVGNRPDPAMTSTALPVGFGPVVNAAFAVEKYASALLFSLPPCSSTSSSSLTTGAKRTSGWLRAPGLPMTVPGCQLPTRTVLPVAAICPPSAAEPRPASSAPPCAPGIWNVTPLPDGPSSRTSP